MASGLYPRIRGAGCLNGSTTMSEPSGLSIHITGIVQGVGFRPFVYGLAMQLALTGWVRNTAGGVDIEADGAPEALEKFIAALKTEPPPLARIDSLDVQPRPPNGFSEFEIVHSEGNPDDFIPISPDVSVCADCLRELSDPADRRYRYPFINCTNCGPRFTIIADIPYDRPKTSMAGFELCPYCAAEYADPLNRRFHAQPVACPECGPQIWLEEGESYTAATQAPEDSAARFPQRQEPDVPASETLQRTRQRLAQGQIAAIKGLGGFHLACDARNDAAVHELRRRKLRVDKPFALMMPNIAAVEEHCLVSEAERELLESVQRPIVILERRPASTISAAVAPNQDTLGVMLPYTPLHHLLFWSDPDSDDEDTFLTALVMTSGNLSEEPIATGNQEARERLISLADFFLMHDRQILTRCDDSVFRALPQDWIISPNGSSIQTSRPYFPLRRARGYAPDPIQLPWEMPPLLAVGPELKNTFCLTRNRYAFLSHHIGDLENYETLRAFEEGIQHYERLFRIHPEAIAYDLHPDYLATRYAQQRAEREGLPLIGVQHHHAHIAACMAENDLPPDHPVIGLSFDGTGYGDDGAIWGGEFLLADYTGYERAYHLAYVPLPGGETAIREPWRSALAWLWQAGIPWAEDLPPVKHARSLAQPLGDPLVLLQQQLEVGLNTPPTSSLGRLFDSAAALVGVRPVVNYEAQAAIELEALVDPDERGAYPIEIGEKTIDPAPLFQVLVDDLRFGVPPQTIAARFHNSLASAALRVCQTMRRGSGVADVALSGGVWQNFTLLRKTVPLLRQDGFAVYLHRHVPPNDGGLSLGQAAIAFHRLDKSAR